SNSRTFPSGRGGHGTPASLARLSAIAGGSPEKSGADLRATGFALLVPFAFGGCRAGIWGAAWTADDGAKR
ncbi:hypothetical protein, partial [Corynebacterium diphtheriae]|uniref:hypothetical protein n=1 Tax=Corynebacterium diphtheriae TaxID=1717 RepID=UPI001C6378B5